MNYTLVISGVSALALGNSIFFGAYLLTLKKKSKANLYLALLLFALAIRIAKSVVIIVFPNAPQIIADLGLVGMAAIGPLFFLYACSVLGGNGSRNAWFHFISSLVLALSVPFVSEQTVYIFYQLVVGQVAVYLIASIAQLRLTSANGSREKAMREWMGSLLIGVGLIWLAFLIQLVWDDYLSYFIATTVAALVLYVLGFSAMRKQKIFIKGEKNTNGELGNVAQRIMNLLEEEKVYRDINLSSQKMAKLLDVPSYQVSQAINETFSKSYPELVNEYRINEVKHMLSDPQNEHVSIEAIAYDCGFVTPSAFYTTFKKLTGTTPGAFRSNRN